MTVRSHLPVGPASEEVVIHLGHLRPALGRAAVLFVETILIPTLLLALVLHLAGPVAGLSAVLAWCAFTVTWRWIRGRRMPGTILVWAAMQCGRAGVALAFSSALVYLVQPVIGSVITGALFLGSALIGKPITIRLARDFVSLPAHMFHLRGVRRMFTQVAALWGASRLIDAGMNFGFLHFGGLDAALLSRGVFSSALTVLTVAACTFWGVRSLRRLPGITLRLRPVAAPGG